MVPSIYQKNIYDAIAALNVGENLVVDAKAGSGKSTTIVNSLEQIPFVADVLFLAFNKSIADSLKLKVPMNTQCSTLNGFGFSACRPLGRPKLDARKTELILDSLVEKKEFYKIRQPINQLVGLLKAWLVSPHDATSRWEELATQYGIEVPEERATFGQTLARVYARCVDNRHIIDFDDQIFLPVYLNLPIPQFDYVFVDEAQDLNYVQQVLVQRAAKRVIAVGDPNQAIYQFRGADPDSMPNFTKMLNAKVLPLSVCYRCPRSVIKYAQNIVPDIQSHEGAAEGIVATKSLKELRELWRDGDYVLCRITAPLVSECLQMIREGRKATVKGRDIGQQLADFLKKIVNQKGTGTDILEQIQSYRTKQFEKLSKLDREQEIIALDDKCDTLIALYEFCDPSLKQAINDQIQDAIERIFSDASTGGITFSTVHKAKGLEADRITILELKLMPHPRAKLASQKKQEMNLKYVAVTRAMKELYFASDSRSAKKLEKRVHRTGNTPEQNEIEFKRSCVNTEFNALPYNDGTNQHEENQ